MAGQAWSPSADGGFFANPTLSRKLRYAAQPMLKCRPYARPVDGFGKGKGDTVDYDKISNVQTQGGEIQETQRMPETKYLIRRGQIIVKEFGNSIPWTGKLETLSTFDITNPTQKVMRDDQVKVIDKTVATKLKDTKIKVYATVPTGATFNTAGSMGAGTQNMNLTILKDMIDKMVEDLVPPATGGPDGDFVLLGTQKALRGLIDDPEFQEWTKYTQADKLLSGEVGKIYRARVIITTHTDALTKKNSGTVGEALLLGDDSVVEAVALPEELRAKTPDDYGRSKGIGWYFLGNWVHAWDFATDAEYRVMHFGSSNA